MLVLTAEHGGAVHQAVDPGSGRVVCLKMSLKLHKEDGDTPADTQSNSLMTLLMLDLLSQHYTGLWTVPRVCYIKTVLFPLLSSPSQAPV